MLIGKSALEKTETDNCFQIKTSYQRNTATSAARLQSPTILAQNPDEVKYNSVQLLKY